MRAILVPAVMSALSFCGYQGYSAYSHHRTIDRGHVAKFDGRTDGRERHDGRSERNHFSPGFVTSYRTPDRYRHDGGCERQCHFHDRGEQNHGYGQNPTRPHDFSPENPQQQPPPQQNH